MVSRSDLASPVPLSVADTTDDHGAAFECRELGPQRGSHKRSYSLAKARFEHSEARRPQATPGRGCRRHLHVWHHDQAAVAMGTRVSSSCSSLRKASSISFDTRTSTVAAIQKLPAWTLPRSANVGTSPSSVRLGVQPRCDAVPHGSRRRRCGMPPAAAGNDGRRKVDGRRELHRAEVVDGERDGRRVAAHGTPGPCPGLRAPGRRARGRRVPAAPRHAPAAAGGWCSASSPVGAVAALSAGCAVTTGRLMFWA